MSITQIVMKNLSMERKRSVLLGSFIFILSFVLFLSLIIIKSLDYGLNSTKARLGADIIIVPKGFVSTVQDSLFMGEPCTVYFNQDIMNQIHKSDGISKITAELYLATLADSDCCDNAVQIIAFNPDSDFIIQPWIKNKMNHNLKNNQIVVGHNISYHTGDTATYYGVKFVVAAKLDKTGMGYDNSVFLNYHTAYELVTRPIICNYFSIGNHKDLSSMFLIQVKKGYQIKSVANKIRDDLKNENISVYTTNSFVNTLGKNLNRFTKYSELIIALLFLLTVFSLASIFTITINERRKEFGILSTIGISRKKMILIIISEAEVISLLGSFFGCLSSIIIYASFHNYFSIQFHIPFLEPNLLEVFAVSCSCIIIALVTGLIASLYSVINISVIDPYQLIRESE